MSTLLKIIFLTLIITICLNPQWTDAQNVKKDKTKPKPKRIKSEDQGGFSWARAYNYEQEDMEMGIQGRQFKRILEASSYDMMDLIELRATATGKVLTSKDIEKIEKGTGRDPKTCEIEDQDGGEAAKLGTFCNIQDWTQYRKDFLKAIVTTTFDVEILKRHPTDVELKFNEYLSEQLDYFANLARREKNKPDDNFQTGYFNFFKDLCISCTGEPLLMCATNRTSPNANIGICKCWDYYLTQKVNGQDECRIAVGKRCHHVYGAKCVVNAFCDQQYICRCMTRRKCAGVRGQMGQGQWYTVIVMGFLLFGLRGVIEFNV